VVKREPRRSVPTEPQDRFSGRLFHGFFGAAVRPHRRVAPHINRYGVTAGVSFKGTSSTTTIGLIATIGTGRSYGINDQNQQINADAQSEAIYFTLGGSTRLGDPPEKTAPAPPAETESVEKAAEPRPATLTPGAEPTEAPEKPAGDVKARRKLKMKGKMPRRTEDGQP